MEKDNKKQITLRLDEEIVKKIDILAKNEVRDRNKQVEYMLIKYLEIKGM